MRSLDEVKPARPSAWPRKRKPPAQRTPKQPEDSGKGGKPTRSGRKPSPDGKDHIVDELV